MTVLWMTVLWTIAGGAHAERVAIAVEVAGNRNSGQRVRSVEGSWSFSLPARELSADSPIISSAMRITKSSLGKISALAENFSCGFPAGRTFLGSTQKKSPSVGKRITVDIPEGAAD